jgi:tetratricopeptide (TPR) repeat protein
MAARRKVLLIGWDSADWRVLSPLLDEGLLPALSSVINRGVMGNLGTVAPILSPIVWTSIATGKLPHKHGVLGFAEPDPLGGGVRAVGSRTRRCRALWNLLSDSGLAAHVVGWYAGHPAEGINGVCVSERFPLFTSLTQATPWPLPEGAVSPPELAVELAPFRVHPTEIAGGQLLPFIPRAAELDQRDPVVAKRLNQLAAILAQTASVQAVATWILEHREWDFLGVYFRALDDLAHHFMPFHPPCLPGVSGQDVAIYGEVMRTACRFHDLMLARLLQLAGPDTTVMLVSDHGFESGARRPGPVADHAATMSSWHRPFGILALAGPGIAADERIYGSSVLDIAPTVLHLFGLPVGQDMDGKVLVNALTATSEVQRIPTWEKPAAASAPGSQATAGTPEEEQAVFDQLVALGYLAEPDADLAKQTKNVADELSYNRVSSLLFAQQTGEAEAEARRLAEANPTNQRFQLKHLQTLLHRRRFDEARQALRAIESRFGASADSERMFAHLAGLQGQLDEALSHFQRAVQAAPHSPAVHEQLGHLLLKKRGWREAEQSFRRALELEPDTPTAYVGLSRALARQEKNSEAVEAVLTGLGLQHHLPAGHYQLGAILTKLRFWERAIQAFETGLTMQPGNLLAHQFLCRLYRRIGRDAQAAKHRQRLRELAPHLACDEPA